MFAIKLALAGIGPLVAHWGIGLTVIAICLVIEFAAGWVVSYVPLLKEPIAWGQKYVLLVAIGTALILLGEYIGAKDIAGRCDAKAAVVSTEVHKAVVKAHRPQPQGHKSKWETDK